MENINNSSLFKLASLQNTKRESKPVVATPTTTPPESGSNQRDVTGNSIDGNNLNSAQRVLGADFVLELNFEDADTKAFFKDISPAVTLANQIVIDLRLKSVSSELTQTEQKELNLFNDFISAAYLMRERADVREQERMEAEALNLVSEAEALLSASTTSNYVDLESICERCVRVEAIVEKLGSKASIALQHQLAELKKAVEAIMTVEAVIQ